MSSYVLQLFRPIVALFRPKPYRRPPLVWNFRGGDCKILTLETGVPGVLRVFAYCSGVENGDFALIPFEDGSYGKHKIEDIEYNPNGSSFTATARRVFPVVALGDKEAVPR